jgi:single-strand DNA-binding protein
MKNLTIAGRLTKDATTRDAGSDKVTGFSVAVDDRNGKEKTTLFFDCSIWGKRGESLAQYLTKGTSVTASGDLGTREYEGKTYLTLRVDQVTLQGGKASCGGGGESQEPARTGTRTAAYDLSDDIPFVRRAMPGEA